MEQDEEEEQEQEHQNRNQLKDHHQVRPRDHDHGPELSLEDVWSSYSEAEQAEIIEEYKFGVLKTAIADADFTAADSSPSFRLTRTRARPTPTRPPWPSPLDEGAGDMEVKDLDLNLHDNKKEGAAYSLHTSLLDSGQAGIDETSRTFLDMLNDESTLSSIGGDADQDDSIAGTLDTSRVDADLIDLADSFREVSQKFDEMSDKSSLMNFSKIEPHIGEVKDAISKRDAIIQQLITSHKDLEKKLKDKVEESTVMSDEMAKLRATVGELEGSYENCKEVVFTGVNSEAHAIETPIQQKVNSDQCCQTEALGNDQLSPSTPSPLPADEHAHDLDDLRLQVSDLEKKLEAKTKYIEEMTAERETERDEFHRELENSDKKFTELKKEKERLEEINAQHLIEVEMCEDKLKEADEAEQQLIGKAKHSEEELKIAVEKIYELRDIIRDLEQQIDSASAKATELKEQNEMLTDEIDRLEQKDKERGDKLETSQETLTSGVPEEVIDDIQTQLSDLTSKLEKKLVEMDSCPWAERPNSSCSGGQYASNDDVSVKEISGLSRTIQQASPYLIADCLCRLEAHFDSLMRFEELILKKVKDNDIRYGNAKKRNEELENEKVALQETIKEQILKISDMQSRLDQFRFEPSPNAVTLTGLRARVQFLSEQLEEYKGKLQLKLIENQDVEQKLASAQALLAKYTAQQQQQQQQKQAASKKTECAIVQTEPVIILRQQPNKAKEASVQTSCAGVQTQVPWFDTHPLESLEFSAIQGAPPPTHSTPNDPIDVGRRKKTTSWASSIERRSPEMIRYGEMAELQNTPLSSFGKSPETDLTRNNMEKEFSFVMRKNQDLEQKLVFAQELIVKLQQTPKVIKIASTQTDVQPVQNLRSMSTQTDDEVTKPEAAEAVAQTSLLDISSTIQKNADLQNELASARLLISKLQAPKKTAVTQTNNIVVKNVPVQTESERRPTMMSSQVQTENLRLTCGHENEIQSVQRKNRDLEHKLACAQEAISKLQKIKAKVSSPAQTQTDGKVLKTFSGQTDTLTLTEPAKDALHFAMSKVSNHNHHNNLGSGPLPLDLEIHAHHASSLSNDSWWGGDDEIHGVHKKNFAASLELYLRVKSHRKALCWQKKYLAQVVDGYKDLLVEAGVGTQHPDYFKKRIPIVPGAIGAVNRRAPLTRFRIAVRVVIATTRMQHMVTRWSKRIRHHSQEAAKENSPPPVLPSKRLQTIPPLKIPTGVSKTELRNVLTQHYERFKSLEDEIAHTMTNRLKKPAGNKKK